VDGLGSTRALTDISGLLTDAYAYEAFGEIIKQLGNTQNSYLFAGEQRDPNLGLDYLRARYLDVNSGRFYGRDIFRGYHKNPITLNKFIYANSNPVNIIDPSGKFGLIGFATGYYFAFFGPFFFGSSRGLNSNDGDSTSLGPQYDSNHYLYHKFHIKTLVPTDSTPSDVYQVLKSYPAPFRDRNGLQVSNGERSSLNGNYIRTIVYEQQLSLVNETERQHIFYPGKTVRRVINKNGQIFLDTTGDGEGLFPVLNVIMGPILFSFLDRQIISDLLE